MRNIIIAIFLVFTTNLSFSQSSDTALINLNSDGFLVNVRSFNISNNLYGFPRHNDNSSGIDITLGLDATAWKFTKKYNVAGMTSVYGEYVYLSYKEEYQNVDQVDADSYYKYRAFFGDAFGEGDYYFNDNIYSTASLGTQFYNGTNEIFDVVSEETSIYPYKEFYMYSWLGVGFGRIINTSSITKQINFEKILREQKLIDGPLSADVKSKLDVLLEKRNNKDFISEYHDNSDAIFFAEVEKVLKSSGVIENTLNAETTIRMYDALNNSRYLYYPNYTGFQLQLEAQEQLNNDIFQNFLTFSGIYGRPLSSKANFLVSGFFSLPLNEHADAQGLFYNGFKNPFDNFLPVIVERYKIDNTSYLRSKEYVVSFDKNLNYLTGAKALMFYKLNEFAGIRGYVSSVLSKPDSLSVANSSNIGAILDYNIFSHLTLNFQTEYNITSDYKPEFYYNLGFLWNIF